MAARADQGVFNMNGNPELNVDTQYLAFTRIRRQRPLPGARFRHRLSRRPHRHHQNRQPSARRSRQPTTRTSASARMAATSSPRQPAGPGTFDFVFWGALQNGNWGELSQQRRRRCPRRRLPLHQRSHHAVVPRRLVARHRRQQSDRHQEQHLLRGPAHARASTPACPSTTS